MREDELVRLIARHAGPVGPSDVGIGDDCAVVDAHAAVISHDMLVEDVHFRWSWAAPGDVGHKALAVNLSDIASMGASPTACVVGLALGPGPLAQGDAVAGLYDAMAALAASAGCAIVGGDTSSAAVTVVGVTALGAMPEGRAPVLRSGGRPGDALWVSGPVGAAAAGLAVLEGRVDRALDPDGALRTAQRRPQPRCALGVELARRGAHAMIDCSDGLARDIGRLARASGLRAVIDMAAVPVAPGVADVARALGREPAAYAATGGEDYELIVALPGDEAPDRALGLVRVGYLEEGDGVRTTPPGALGAADLGFQHTL